MLDTTEQLRRETTNSPRHWEKCVSVVTPTLHRPAELADLLDSLSHQTLLPMEVIIVDGSPGDETEVAIRQKRELSEYPFVLRYIRQGGGTADQRNHGIDLAQGDYVALIDDDVRLDTRFLAEIVSVFEKDNELKIGGVVGYRTNRHFSLENRSRWRWYRRLGLLKSFEAGRYDFETGYPINNNMQPPFSGTRRVDFMTTACAVWRKSVFDEGLRFDRFFKDYGVLEDAHFSLRAAKRWKLVQCGDARCLELNSPNGRVSRERIGYKCVVNYYYVFNDIAGPLGISRKFRFWRFQAFEICRVAISAIRRRSSGDAFEVVGRISGVFAVMRGKTLD